MAGLLGKEASLWLPTGTIANQVALRVSPCSSCAVTSST